MSERINDQQITDLLAALAVPPLESIQETVRNFGGEIGFHLETLVTSELVETVWTTWNPDQRQRLGNNHFREAFADLLAQGIAMGFRLDRFQEISRVLPDPDESALNWIPLFEGVVAGQGNCRLRLSLTAMDFETYSRTEEGDGQSWRKMMQMMYDGLFYELGIILPVLEVKVDETLPPQHYRLEWNDLVLPARPSIGRDQILVNDTVNRLQLLNLSGTPHSHPANGSEMALVDAEWRDLCESAGLTTWDYRGYLILEASAAIRKAARAFVNRHYIEYCRYQLRRYLPYLRREIGRQIGSDFLTQIVRGLLDEGISVRDFRTILHAILSVTDTCHVDQTKHIIFSPPASRPLFTTSPTSIDQLTPNDYVGHIRIALKRYISHKYTRGQSTLIVYLLDPVAEHRLRQPVRLTPAEKANLISEIASETGSTHRISQTAVILTSLEVRHNLRRELRHAHPDLAVICYQELSPELNIQPIARIHPELKPYDEALFSLLERLASDLPDAAELTPWPAISGKETEERLFRFLDANSTAIIVETGHQWEDNDPLPQAQMHKLIGWMLNAYGHFVLGSGREPIEALLHRLQQIAQENNQPADSFGKIFREMMKVIRQNLIAQREQDGLDIAQALQRCESAAYELTRIDFETRLTD